MVALGKVLTHRKEFIEIDDLRTYKRCRVQLHAQGIVLRDAVQGVEIKTKKQQVCRTGELLVAEIDAKVGGFGIVPPDLEGAVVSSHYFLFQVNDANLDSRFLAYFIRTRDFLDQVTAQGSTNYAAIRPKDVLEYMMPLPPPEEQRRIVAKIDTLAAKIEEAKTLRREAEMKAGAFTHSHLDQLYATEQSVHGLRALGDVCASITDGAHLTPSFVDQGVKFIFVGNVSSGFLHFKGCKHVTAEYYRSVAPSRKPERGDILYSAVGATLGIPAMVDGDEDFCFQRHVAILKPDRSKIDSTYLWYMLRSGVLFQRAWSAITGTAQPTVPLKAIRTMSLPVPPLSEQRRIVARLDRLHAKIEAIKAQQTAAARELSALLPAILDQAFTGAL
jgi:type I restriction enzyme S subunit